MSFNTAVSFLTNTNWQAYAGESTMSHPSQMLALELHQYVSAAVGMAVAVGVEVVDLATLVRLLVGL